ncbi:MAG: hypothetical protein UT86_C0001G0100 [Candidatus Magasanikbacteria bacterium GW2011_GWC2_40_17]|uniref:DUF8128 domain-containing protein n=1 Tax=Candidatus Magasanikbacteria bacterium GW2011_GWA2_42_32 TaxID=1619039 RepID=A0A0G1A8W3_9BACT|nr:MAG: hypothetical protein UT86_C0001G0100 [Candidatus Magasanikbacteria bacterium GW2011_GWC2_40_17]KKS57460.1 MAG: hypothetical protein UV20_C0001G0100 [Candidatus Magasanikbacteria bacterium GW2011_GWA2_42_32]OGH85180.1 MAG: hypothetical protein A2294_00310 [Candidatus Magasanikbacteria bacterium RIFOXYB2_FULL_38_10]
MITIDWTPLLNFINFVSYAPSYAVYYYLLVHGGWFVVVIGFYHLFLSFYILNRITSYMVAKYKWAYLAVDVPKGNEQTPKAVESIFSHLAGAHKDPDMEEAVLDGYLQPWFSLEIISIEGYVQFVVATLKKYRDLIEAAIYAQYPEAEITEIEDYTKDFPTHFPNKDYNLWGTEYVFTNPEESYPIKTYTDFEHSGAEDVFKDPLAALLETFSRLGKGEFVGLQILVKPISNKWHDWKKHGLEVVKKMTGATVKQKESNMYKVGSIPGKIFDTALSTITGVQADQKADSKKDDLPSLMLHLPPGFKTDIEKVERKISKICFATKIRCIYLAKKESYSKNRIAYGTTGAIKQFITENLNGLKPEFEKVGTHTHYYLKETRLNWRKTKLVNAYMARSRWKGIPEYLMNTEELATLWHFPMLTVRAPMVAMAEAKKGQPPSGLPTERANAIITPLTRKSVTPPSNLPI